MEQEERIPTPTDTGISLQKIGKENPGSRWERRFSLFRETIDRYVYRAKPIHFLTPGNVDIGMLAPDFLKKIFFFSE